MEEGINQISNILGNLKCKDGKTIKFLCQQKQCKYQPFMCASQDCKCYLQHGQCAVIQYKSLVKHLESNKNIDKNYIESLDEKIRIINQMIDKLSEQRNKIQQQKEWCGIGRKGRMFLQYVRDNQLQKITSSMINQLFNEVKTQESQSIDLLSKDKIKKEWQISTKKLFEQLVQRTKVQQTKKMFTNSDIILMEDHEIKLCGQIKGRNVKKIELYDNKKFKHIMQWSNNQDTLILIKTHTKKIIAVYIPFRWSQYKQKVIGKTQSFVYEITDNKMLIQAKQVKIEKKNFLTDMRKNIQTNFASANRTKVLQDGENLKFKYVSENDKFYHKQLTGVYSTKTCDGFSSGYQPLAVQAYKLDFDF